MSSPKIKTLARLADLYSLIETQRAASLSRSTSAMQNIEQQLEDQLGSISRLGASSLKSLVQADRLEWLLFESERECSARNVADLQVVLKRRQEMRNDALKQYSETLLKRDQLNTVVDAIKKSLRNIEQRREQGFLDDRFLARSNWLRVRQQRKMNPS